jgi:hypothetical protein
MHSKIWLSFDRVYVFDHLPQAALSIALVISGKHRTQSQGRVLVSTGVDAAS